MSCFYFRWFKIYLFHLFLSSALAFNESVSIARSFKSDIIPYCSFFSNRAPSPQPGLTNCTWFKENSCCHQNEVQLIFSQVRPLIGSSSECTRFLNILMCYVCSPLQHSFYRSERLHVCLSYCDRMFKACATALMKGTPVGELYASGREFCLSRRFEINDSYNASACFSDEDLRIPAQLVDTVDVNMASHGIEQPHLFELFLVVGLATMFDFTLC